MTTASLLLRDLHRHLLLRDLCRHLLRTLFLQRKLSGQGCTTNPDSDCTTDPESEVSVRSGSEGLGRGGEGSRAWWSCPFSYGLVVTWTFFSPMVLAPLLSPCLSGQGE